MVDHRQAVYFEAQNFMVGIDSRAVGKAYQAETEARLRHQDPRPRRDRGWSSSWPRRDRGEAYRVRDESEARRSRVRGETEAYESEMIHQSFKAKVESKH